MEEALGCSGGAWDREGFTAGEQGSARESEWTVDMDEMEKQRQIELLALLSTTIMSMREALRTGYPAYYRI